MMPMMMTRMIAIAEIMMIINGLHQFGKILNKDDYIFGAIKVQFDLINLWYGVLTVIAKTTKGEAGCAG